MRADWEGVYFDGRVTVRQAARVRVLAEGLEVVLDGGHPLRWAYRDLVQTQGFYAGEQVRLEPRGGAAGALVVPDPGILTAIRQAAGPAARHLHAPARRWLRGPGAAAAAVAVAGLAALLYLQGIPAMAAAVAPRVPVSWEERVGQAVVDYMVPEDARCADVARTRALDAIVATLASTVPASPYRFRVVVADFAMVNALAAPGGHIIVFRGLLERTESAEEMAGVLAHELQHVLRRHVARAVVQHTSTGLVLGALTGDASGLVALEAARALGTLHYSRQHELEADAEGLRMLVAAGIDPQGMIAFFDGLRKSAPQKDAEPQPGLLRYLATHPGDDERIARLTALAASVRQPATKLLPAFDWADVRTACGKTPAPAAAPAAPAASGPVYLVPVGDVAPDRLDRLERYYSDRFGLRIERLPAVPVEAAFLDATRGQLVAEDVAAAIRRQHDRQAGDPQATLIGLVGGDMHVRESRDAWAFAYRDSGRVAVVSSARMDPASWGLRADPDLLEERLRKMVSRQIGHLHFHLGQSDDRGSVMFGPIARLDDLDDLAEDF
jgi:Zn-dependent protease with chaperone function/predicted Zn-dependent protease